MVVSKVLLIILLAKSIRSDISNLRDEFSLSQIILFYAPVNSEFIREQIVIYWNNINFIYGDVITLHFGDPNFNESQLLFAYVPKSQSGFVKTERSPEEELYLLNKTYEEQCLGYYGSWIRDGVIKKSNCLSTHPDWMYKHREVLKNMTLGNLFLPGTHNSGSYESSTPQTVFERYAITQDRDVFDQLVSGSRYLDIRPCKNNSLKYWICHGSFFIRPLSGIIYDIKDFMTNTKEIVILSFKEFSQGFDTNDDHLDFIKYLTESFDTFLWILPIDVLSIITLENIWLSKYRLILSYDHKVQQTTNFGSSIFQFWPRVNSVDELLSSIDEYESKYLTKTYQITPENPVPLREVRAIMAEVTLDSTSIFSDAFAHFFGKGSKSLLQLGVEIGPRVTALFNEKFNLTANIVAVDFIDTTGIVEVAIHANLLRASYNRINHG